MSPGVVRSPGRSSRAWRVGPRFRPFGPASVLLARLWRVGACWPEIDVCHFPVAAPVPVRDGPVQWVSH
eukprot:7058344-Lingulodinium_polyedra.AAC.1